MELKIKNGDYVADGAGGLLRVSGREALLQRVLFRLTARRGTFPVMPDMGSRLWQLGRLSPSQRLPAAKQYVAEALEAEPVQIRDVLLSAAADGGAEVTVQLEWQGEPLAVTMDVQM